MDENYLPVVVGAAVVGDRVLRLLFSDGTVGDVDFSSERWTGVLVPLNDPAYVAQVGVDPERPLVVIQRLLRLARGQIGVPASKIWKGVLL